MSDEERGYARGARAAWIHVLNLLNTLDSKRVAKKAIYAMVADLEVKDLGPAPLAENPIS